MVHTILKINFAFLGVAFLLMSFVGETTSSSKIGSVYLISPSIDFLMGAGFLYLFFSLSKNLSRLLNIGVTAILMLIGFLAIAFQGFSGNTFGYVYVILILFLSFRTFYGRMSKGGDIR